MARSQNPITKAAAVVAVAKAKADRADAAVVRMRVAENAQRQAHAELAEATAALTALLTTPAAPSDDAA